MLRIKGISRKYLRLAAAYRRFAGDQTQFSFTVEALIECHAHESSGAPASKNNGYVFGKWCKDLSVVQWIEDIKKGNACKAEFYTPKDTWWARRALKNVVVPCSWFPFSNERSVSHMVKNGDTLQSIPGESFNQIVRERFAKNTCFHTQ